MSNLSVFGIDDDTARGNILRMWRQATSEHHIRGRVWYDVARDIATSIGAAAGFQDGQATILGAALLAIFSPRCTWQRNVELAYAFATGNECRTMYNAIAKANEALRLARGGENPLMAVSGRKVSTFAQAILGYENAVVVDIWALGVIIGRRANEKDYGFLKRHGVYDAVTQAYLDVSNHLAVKPTVLQAVTWTAFRSTQGYDWAG